MTPGPRQVPQLGESPTEARERMAANEPPAEEVAAPVGTEVDGPLTPAQMAAIAAEDEGFGGSPDPDGPAEEHGIGANGGLSPTKAFDTIQNLTNEKFKLIAERDAAIAECEAYFNEFGPLPGKDGDV